MNRLALIAVVAVLAGCSTLRPKPAKSLACQSSPQWITNDAKGIPAAAVFVCFGEDGRLLWQARPLTLDELQKLTTPAPAAAAEQPAKAELAWDRPECAYYRPEAQAKFCHRVKAKAKAKK